MGRKIIKAFMILVLIVGAGIIIYPSFANWWNQQQQNGAIVRYTRMVEAMEPEQVTKMRKEAQQYNATHPVQPAATLEGKARDEYNSVLDVSGTGIMGYVEIPKIDVDLPIYHGTTEAVLQVAIGHLEGTSLPVGGASTHCVISGHTGLPAAELFTRIDELKEGDRFNLQVLGESLVYEVDKIDVVLPSVLDGLAAVEGEDYCTLVTCTPYGINTHRLLVRGKRIPPEPEPVIDDPEKAAARALLVQQMRASDLRYFRRNILEDIFINIPIILCIAVFFFFIHFLHRKNRWRRWAEEAVEEEEPQITENTYAKIVGRKPENFKVSERSGNPDDWWNGG